MKDYAELNTTISPTMVDCVPLGLGYSVLSGCELCALTVEFEKRTTSIHTSNSTERGLHPTSSRCEFVGKQMAMACQPITVCQRHVDCSNSHSVSLFGPYRTVSLSDVARLDSMLLLKSVVLRDDNLMVRKGSIQARISPLDENETVPSDAEPMCCFKLA